MGKERNTKLSCGNETKKLESSRAGGKDSPGKFNFNWAEEIAFCSLHDAILSSPYCTAHRVK